MINRIAGAGGPAHSATPCRELPAIHLAGLSPGVHENARSTLDPATESLYKICYMRDPMSFALLVLGAPWYASHPHPMR
jgi:hypothetical protein